MIGDLDDVTDVDFIEKDVRIVYPRFDNSELWMKDVRHTYDWLRVHHRNPFVKHEHTYKDVAEIAKRVMYSLGKFESAECKSVKDTMVDMDPHAVGRVQLADYYRSNVIDFPDSTEFLRTVGALDESNPQSPSIIIPNYLGMSGNCAMAVEYYSVCCFDECEDLMQTLEQAIGAPGGTPAKIVSVISNLASDTVEAPRNLSTLLLTRLDEIANVHGGEVLLHGRLFMQWMHHAYPRECVFPHVAGTINPHAEWEGVSDEEKEKHLVRDPSQKTITTEESINALPWSSVEELVAESNHPAPKSSMMSKLRFMVGVLALASIVLPMMRSSKLTGSSESFDKLCV